MGPAKSRMEVLKIREHRELAEAAAAWFHARWGIPEAEYAGSIRACLAGGAAVPQWYVMALDGEILAGAGVIANDFHCRKDLTPNLCALYVEKPFRGQGIAGILLDAVCTDMGRLGVPALYLVTDHVSFYERYGWRFLCMVREEGGSGLIRMYTRTLPQPPSQAMGASPP